LGIFAKVLKDLMNRFGLPSGVIKPLESSYSEVYEFENKNKLYILKLKKVNDTNLSWLQSEIEWLEYLNHHGLSVSCPIKFCNNRYFERFVVDETSYLSIIYEKAFGISPRKKYHDHKYYPESFLFEWGKYAGKMHRLSKTFRPSLSFTRPQWINTIDFFDLENPPPSQEKVCLKFQEQIEKINGINQDKNFGLVHNDFLEDNFYLFNHQLTVFDFEDFGYNFFANDMAIPLFYPVVFNMWEPEEQKKYADYFLIHFLEGYRNENPIEPSTLEMIPLFLKIREMDNYSMYYSDPIANQYQIIQKFMENRQQRIENDVPVLDVDFTKYIN
jgi:Ser/Thr protein kinase RdoA (MazF antagonist)